VSNCKNGKGAFVGCRDHSEKRPSGKFETWTKGQKPENRLVSYLEGQCDKKCFRSIERVKFAVQKSERRRLWAEAEGRSSKRQEIRWYECNKHAVKMYHLTSVSEDLYIARFEASKRGEFSLAA